MPASALLPSEIPKEYLNQRVFFNLQGKQYEITVEAVSYDTQYSLSLIHISYIVKVHVDADGDMVIVQNPTLAPAIEQSDYEPKTPEPDASVDLSLIHI